VARVVAKFPLKMSVRLRDHGVVIANSAAMAAGGLLSAVLGFAFWWLATQTLPPEAIGYASATISMMALIALLGEGGFGTILLGDANLAQERKATIVWSAFVAGTLAAVLLAAAYAAVALAYPAVSVFGSNELFLILIFVAGCMFTGFGIVLDQAAMGYLAGHVYLARNVAAGLIKIAAFVAAVYLFAGQEGQLLLIGAWTLALTVSALLAVWYAQRTIPSFGALPDLRSLRPFVHRIVQHHAANLAVQAPALLLPVIVTLLVSPAANGAFAPAWMIINVALIVPASITTVFYTGATARPDTRENHLALTLGGLGAFSVTAVPFLFLASELILGVFGPFYAAEAGMALSLCALGLPAIAGKQLFLAFVRMRKSMREMLPILLLTAIAETGGAALGAWHGGLDGLVVGWLAGVYACVPIYLFATLQFRRDRDRQYSPPEGGTDPVEVSRPAKSGSMRSEGSKACKS
jgi:O-antigen/teichoic acid export membrane protein